VNDTDIFVWLFDVSAKDAKVRECFEKVFPELKKQREDKERVLGYVCFRYLHLVDMCLDTKHLPSFITVPA